MHLAYTIAFDAPETGGHRLLAKMLAMSLSRCHFDGDILIFRNSEAPISESKSAVHIRPLHGNLLL